MTVRRTSQYTVQITDATPAMIDRRVRRLVEDRPVTDRQDQGFSFRAADDADALAVLTRIMTGGETAIRLTTGLGVHRREVQA